MSLLVGEDVEDDCLKNTTSWAGMCLCFFYLVATTIQIVGGGCVSLLPFFRHVVKGDFFHKLYSRDLENYVGLQQATHIEIELRV